MLINGLQDYPFKMNVYDFVCDNDDNAVAKISFSSNDYCCFNGDIPPSYLIESMGQVVEKCLITQGNAKKRYLVGIDKFVINQDFTRYIGKALIVVIKKDIIIGKISRYSAQIFCDDINICRCLITHCSE